MPVLQTRAEELSERGRCSERILVAVRGNGEEVGVKTDFVISHLFSCKEQWEEQWEGLAGWAVTTPEIYISLFGHSGRRPDKGWRTGGW